jgi:hypothetical protein
MFEPDPRRGEGNLHQTGGVRTHNPESRKNIWAYSYLFTNKKQNNFCIQI